MSACLPRQMHWDDTDGSYFSAGGIQQIQAPLTSSSSTSHRGPGKHGVLHFAHGQSFSFRSPLAVRAPEAASVDVDWEAPVKEWDRNRSPWQDVLQDFQPVVFPGTVPVTVPGWFLLLLSPVPVTTFRNGFRYPQTGFLLLLAPQFRLFHYVFRV